MKKFEYLVRIYSSEIDTVVDMEKKLNEKAKEGWRIVSIDNTFLKGILTVFFERPIK